MGKGIAINQDLERAVQQMEREWRCKMKHQENGKALHVRKFKGWKIATYKNGEGRKAYACYSPGAIVDADLWESLHNALQNAKTHIRIQNIMCEDMLDEMDYIFCCSSMGYDINDLIEKEE